MKKAIISAAAIALMTACNQQPASGYSVSGTIESAQEGDTVFLCSMQGFFQFVPEDTAVVGKDGKYEFTGTTEGAAMRFVILATDDTTRQAKFGEIVLENANITLNLPAESSDKEQEVKSDGPAYKLYKVFEAKEKKFNEAVDPYWSVVREQKGTAEEIAQAEQKANELTEANDRASIRMMLDNAPSTFSDMLLPYFMDKMQPEQLDSLMEKLSQSKERLPMYEAIKQRQEAEKATAIGATYTDLAMPDPEGKEMKLSQYVGKSKLVLVDFWASWCGPCRAEMPNVVEAYNKYHAQGLEIIGVSFDNDGDAWRAAIKQLQMPWPQMSDLKGWECAAAPAYNVSAIPANVLLDQDGKIIAKDLREEALHATIEQYINK